MLHFWRRIYDATLLIYTNQDTPLWHKDARYFCDSKFVEKWILVKIEDTPLWLKPLEIQNMLSVLDYTTQNSYDTMVMMMITKATMDYMIH